MLLLSSRSDLNNYQYDNARLVQSPCVNKDVRVLKRPMQLDGIRLEDYINPVERPQQLAI